ncbi:MAG: porin family protein [Akkermansiaceae bacterium]|nr:porin family protein [Akkermansiaceae bacterium]
MKKIPLYLLSLCSAASAAPYYLTTPPGGGLTPADWQPTWRLQGLYAVGVKHMPDTWGFRSGLELYSNADSGIRHEFGLNAAPQWGDGHHHRHGYRSSQDVFHLPLTAGYTLNIGLGDGILLFLSGKAGWAVGHYKEKAPSYRESGSYNGFTFSAGGGLKFQCSERLYVQAGYEFGRTYTNTRHNDTWGQHIISAGIDWRF